MPLIRSRNEFIIKRYVLANQPPCVRKYKFGIGRSFDILGSGWIESDSKDALAKAIREIKIHYPTPEEIEENKRIEQEKYLREKNRVAEAMRKKNFFKPPAKKKKKSTQLSEKKVVEVKGEHAKLLAGELSEVPESQLLSAKKPDIYGGANDGSRLGRDSVLELSKDLADSVKVKQKE